MDLTPIADPISYGWYDNLRYADILSMGMRPFARKWF